MRKDYETSNKIRRVISVCFSTNKWEECMELFYKKSNQGFLFAKKFYDILQSRSPTSLKIIWKKMKQTLFQTLEDCMKIEN
ncbi:enoyl-CoA hydratase/isomerase family protein, partial [Bartonella taylorii]|uniref:enoyl-CoA hydratase/isomerase family protein n=1 Tax=Bartonella taylorii TaxID=33046 RepID=UPI0024868E7D